MTLTTEADSRRSAPSAAARGLVSVWAAALIALPLVGCGAGQTPDAAGGAGRLTAGYHNAEHARWREFDAAVSSALMRNEIAVVERRLETPTKRRWVLITATDEPAWLTAEVPDEQAVRPWDDRVVYECSIGRFGSAPREARFVDSIRAWRPKHTR